MKKLILIAAILATTNTVQADIVPFKWVDTEEKLQAAAILILDGVNCPKLIDLVPYAYSNGYYAYCSNGMKYKIEPNDAGYWAAKFDR